MPRHLLTVFLLNRFCTKMSNLTPVQAAQIVALSEDGRSQRYIAQVMNINQSSVSRILRRFRETGVYHRRPVPGRPRCTIPADDRFLRLQALRERHITARKLRNDLSRVRNVQISINSVRNRLREVGIRARMPVTAPLLTRAHRVARLRFARQHVNWNVNDWANILFTDESRFSIFGSDRRIPVYRREGERFAQCNIRSARNFGGGSIMVWGGICLEGHTELAVFRRGSLTADRYIRDVLEEHVIPFAPVIGINFVLMHDNARPHAARITTDYLREVGIQALAWPAVSPDLNPIEHVWEYLERRIRSRNIAPDSLDDLEHALLEEWETLDMEFVRNLIRSLPQRMRAVIRARGGNTRY